MALTAFPAELDTFYTYTDGVDDPMSATINRLQEAVVALETKVGTGSYSVSLSSAVSSFLSSGRKMYFYRATAPTGWTSLGFSDRVLAVSGGSGLYSADGGNTGGVTSWSTLANHKHTLNGHSHVNSYHVHKWYVFNGPDDNDQIYLSDGSLQDVYYSVPQYYGITAVASNYAPNDSWTFKERETLVNNSDDTGIGSVSDVRPKAVCGVVASKN